MENSILKQLFDGELTPSESLKITDPKFKEAANKLSDIKDSFIKSLSEADSKIFDEIECLNCECSFMCDYEYFAQGFRIGVNLIMEILGYKQG